MASRWARRPSNMIDLVESKWPATVTGRRPVGQRDDHAAAMLARRHFIFDRGVVIDVGPLKRR
jgi:hypothetical protein